MPDDKNPLQFIIFHPTKTWPWPTSAKCRVSAVLYSICPARKFSWEPSPLGSHTRHAPSRWDCGELYWSRFSEAMQCISSKPFYNVDTLLVHFITEGFLHPWSCSTAEDASLQDLSTSPFKLNSQVESQLLKLQSHVCPTPHTAINSRKHAALGIWIFFFPFLWLWHNKI